MCCCAQSKCRIRRQQGWGTVPQMVTTYHAPSLLMGHPPYTECCFGQVLTIADFADFMQDQSALITQSMKLREKATLAWR